MVHTPDNLFAAQAVRNLFQQAVSIYPELKRVNPEDFYRATFYDLHPQFRLSRVNSGPDQGKLTLEERTLENGSKPISGITPVDLYAPIKSGESIAGAVNRLSIYTPNVFRRFLKALRGYYPF